PSRLKGPVPRSVGLCSFRGFPSRNSGCTIGGGPVLGSFLASLYQRGAIRSPAVSEVVGRRRIISNRRGARLSSYTQHKRGRGLKAFRCWDEVPCERSEENSEL